MHRDYTKNFTDSHSAQRKPPGQKLSRRLSARFARFLGTSRSSAGRNRMGALPFWDLKAPDLNCSLAKPRHSPDYVTRAVQLAVHEILNVLYSRRWDTYCVGGTLRDLMIDLSRNGSRYIFPRDVDLVVVGPSLRELEDSFPRDLIQRRTRFGGIHLVKRVESVCEIHFDVWPLDETWAFKQFGLQPTIENFVLTPFLNLDSIAIDLFPRGRGRPKVFENGFFKGVTSRLIDINFEPNPFPDVCAVRALLIAAKLQFTLSRRLAEFIMSRTREPNIVERLVEAQSSHYGQIRTSSDELKSWLKSIDQQLRQNADRIEIRVSNARQLQLWVDFPPLHVPKEDCASGLLNSDDCSASELLTPT